MSRDNTCMVFLNGTSDILKSSPCVHTTEMSSSKKATNIFAILEDDEDLTIQSSALPDYGEKEEQKEEEEDTITVETRIPIITNFEQSEWQESSVKRKKKRTKKTVNAGALVKTAKIAPVYQIFQIPEDVTDIDILGRISSLEIISVDGLKIAQDRNLVYGTKIRAMQFFYKLKDLGYKGVVMAAAAYAPSQITTAWMCAQAELKFHIFVSGCKNKLITPYTQKAIELGATVDNGRSELFNFRHYPRLKEAEAALQIWSRGMESEGWFVLSTGCADDAYMNAIIQNMVELKEEHELNPSEIWVVGITGLIAACLAQAFPESMVHCVSLSDSIWPDLFKTKNFRIHHYPQNLGGVTTEYPFEVPFETTVNFGAKVMFFSNMMASDALIWNTY